MRLHFLPLYRNEAKNIPDAGATILVPLYQSPIDKHAWPFRSSSAVNHDIPLPHEWLKPNILWFRFWISWVWCMSTNMEKGTGLMTHTAASHQVAIKMIRLYFLGAVILSISIFYIHFYDLNPCVYHQISKYETNVVYWDERTDLKMLIWICKCVENNVPS